MRIRPSLSILSALLVSSVVASNAAALVVTEPDGINDTVAAGDDFATQVVGDPWDFSEATDFEAFYSGGVGTETVAGGKYSTTSTNSDPFLWVHFPGVSSTLDLSEGARYRIPTGTYRYVTVKQRVVSAQSQAFMAFFSRDKESFADGSFGFSTFISFPNSQWTIVTLDMVADIAGASAHTWTQYPLVNGFRVEPTNVSGAQIEIDWVRLTSAPSAANRYTVTWTDTVGATYTVTAIDPDGARFQLGTGIAGDNYSADLSRLAPGDYGIEVARTGATATSSGVVHINSPPRPKVTAPSIRGEQALSYAQVQRGNPWGPIDTLDVQNTNFLAGSVVYTNPTGTLYARPKDIDPWIQMRATSPTINADLYRSLCFTMDVFGPPPTLFNSVARIYFGNSFPTLSPTQDILVGRGPTEYCIEDMAVAELEGGTTPWAGTLSIFRVDPHEYSVSAACTNTPTPANCHDVRLHSVVLAPFAATNPTYTIQWNITDAEQTGLGVAVYLDLDRTFNNGNETLIGSPNDGVGSHQLTFASPASLANGKYYVAIYATDGINANVQYSTGPILATFVDLIFRHGFEP